jgi:chromosome segregation ATPase
MVSLFMNFKFDQTIKKNENAEFERKKFGGKSLEVQQQYVKHAFGLQEKKHAQYGEKNPEILTKMFKTEHNISKLTKKAEKYIENSPFKQEIETEITPIKLEKKRKRETIDENEKIIKKKKEELREKQFERKEKKSEISIEIHNIELKIEELKTNIQEIKKQENLCDNILKNDIENYKESIKTIQNEQKSLKDEIKEKDMLIIEEIERIIEKPISEIS